MPRTILSPDVGAPTIVARAATRSGATPVTQGGGMEVRFANFGRSIEGMRPALDRAADRVLASGWLVLGPEGKAFEEALAGFVGSAHAVGCGSGTDAIELALRALGVGAGDEVITQANTCVPTVAAIARAGATPVLCDVEPDGATMDPESLAAAIGPRTKAVVTVHLYGQCADMRAICGIAREHDLHVVEDCAQAIGASFDGAAAGTSGSLGCFSFYPTKNLGALGDGGAVVTDDPDLADRLRKLRVYGQESRYRHELEGVNSRLDELQAAFLGAKIEHLGAWNARRRKIAAAYSAALDGGSARPLAVLPRREHAFHLFVVDAGDRDGYRESLAAQGVETLIHYPLPIHRQPAYAGLAAGPVPLPVSERLAERVLSLPIYPELTDAEVEHVASAVRAVDRPAA